MYKIKKILKEKIEEMRQDYYSNMTSPIDDMWDEAIIPNGKFFVVEEDGLEQAYFVIDDDGVLIAFYVKEKSKSRTIFDFIINAKKIKKAYVASNDPIFYKECLRMKEDISDNTLLYRLNERKEIEPPFENIEINVAEIKEIENILRYFEEDLEMSGEWLKYYFTNLIKNDELYLFKIDGKIIGTGELRLRKGYAHTGMTVSKNHRKKGLAKYIAFIILKRCNEKNYKAICSTTIENIGAQRTLEKVGYECYHKIYNVIFK